MNGEVTSQGSPFPASFEKNPSQVEEIALRCELRELNHPFPNTNADGSEIQQDQILVMEMACHLYLGHINQAWHLWRRTLPSADGNNYRSESLQQMWKVGSAMLANDSIQAISDLKKIQSSPPSPLSSTIISEILENYRERVSENLSTGFMKLNSVYAAEKLGFVNSADSVGYLEKRGWTLKGAFLIPPLRTVRGRTDVKGIEKIVMLTDIVSFMEKERTNA